MVMGAVNGWQLNLHRCYSASATLQRRLEHDDAFVALLQEPHTFGGLATIKPSGAAVFQSPLGDGERNRAAIAVSSSLNAWSVPAFTTNDMVTIALPCSVGTVWCTSIYMPGDSEEPPPSALVRNLVQHCEYKSIPLLIGCDANAHNILWNSTNNNPRGEALGDFIISSNLEICNRGHEPTFVVKNRREVLDLTLVSMCITEEISDWRVDSTPSLSDHRCIRFKIAKQNSTVKVSRNLRRADWAQYTIISERSLSELKTSSLNSIEELDQTASYVTSALSSALDECCPLRTVGSRRITNCWWSRELASKRRRVNSAWNRAHNTDAPGDWDRYHELKRDYKYQIRRAKRSSWRSFCSEFENINESRRIGKLLKRDRRVQLDVLQKADDSYTSDPGETLDLMMSVHYPGSEKIDENYKPRTSELDWSDRRFACFITVDRVARSISSFDSFKSPGGDLISPIMLQRAGPSLAEVMVRMYCASLCFSHVPDTWCGARAVFIPKPGKQTYLKAKSFRPITLTSFFLKVLERLIYWHLSESTGGINPKMHSSQFAFKQGYSTEAALHTVVQKLEKAVFNKKLTLALFLDIEGAFSNVSLTAIMMALVNAKVDVYLVTWIMRMLKSQRVTASLGDCNMSVRLTRGTPQGGVLSPLLFNLVMSELLQKLDTIPGVYTQAYADDVLLLSTGIDSMTLSDRIQEGLRAVEEWAAESGLTLSCEKTFATMFTWKRKWNYYPIVMNGQEIQLVDRVTYLGVTLDSKLSWIPHISDKSAKASRCLLMCRRAVGKTWGLSPRVMMWIYTTMIRPILTYAVTIWAAGLETRTCELKLSRLQRKACMAISAAFPGTPTVALEMLLDIPPLDSYLKGMAAIGAYRLKQAGLWRSGYIRDTMAHQSHVNWCSSFSGRFPAFAPPGDLCSPRLNLQVRFRTSTEPCDPSENVSTVACYTDGSKLESGMAGAGVHFPGGSIEDQVIYLGYYSSVFQAEVLAITLAAERLASYVTQYPVTESVTIYSDSQAAIKAVSALRSRSHMVEQCVDALNSLGNLTDVKVQWVKAHVGTTGNETADFLAKEGAMLKCSGPEPYLPIPYSACKSAVYGWIKEDSKKKWANLSSCKQTKELFRQPLNNKGCLKLLALDRSKLRLTLQILTGHGNFGSHNKTIGKWVDDTCKRCGLEPETRRHIVEECPCYLRARISNLDGYLTCLLYTSPSPRDKRQSRMPSSA